MFGAVVMILLGHVCSGNKDYIGGKLKHTVAFNQCKISVNVWKCEQLDIIPEKLE